MSKLSNSGDSNGIEDIFIPPKYDFDRHITDQDNCKAVIKFIMLLAKNGLCIPLLVGHIINTFDRN